MRERNEIERDFNVAMGSRKEEFLEYQRQKILMEVMLDIRESLRELIKNLGNKRDEKERSNPVKE
ncbi:hypothetical protein ES703_108403 [subsurface metagenome]